MSLFPNGKGEDRFSLLHSHRYGHSSPQGEHAYQHHPDTTNDDRNDDDDVVVLDLGSAPATVLVGHIGSPSRLQYQDDEDEDYPLQALPSGSHYYNNNNGSVGSKHFTSRASEGVGSNKSRTSSARRHARRRSTTTGITNINGEDHPNGYQHPTNIFYCSSSSSPSTLGRRSSGSGGGNRPYMTTTTTTTTITSTPPPPPSTDNTNELSSSSPAEADIQRGLFGTNLSLAKSSWAAPPATTAAKNMFGFSHNHASAAPFTSPPPPPQDTVIPLAQSTTNLMPRPTEFAATDYDNAEIDKNVFGQEGEELLLLLRQCRANKKLRKKMQQKDLAKEKQQQERIAASVLSDKKESRRMKAALKRAQKNSTRAHTVSRQQERKAKHTKKKQLKNTARLFYFESESDGESDAEDIYFVFGSDSEMDGEDGDFDNYKTNHNKRNKKSSSRNKRSTRRRAARRGGEFADDEDYDNDDDDDAESNNSDAFSSSSSEIIIGSTVFAPEERAAHHHARNTALNHKKNNHHPSDFDRYRRGKNEDEYLADDVQLGGSGGYDDRPRMHAPSNEPTSSFFISPIHQSVAEETAPWSTSDTPQYRFLGFGGLSGPQLTAAPPTSNTTPPPPQTTSVQDAKQTAALQREAKRAQEAYHLMGNGGAPAFNFALPDSSKGSKAMTDFQAKGRGGGGLGLAVPLPLTGSRSAIPNNAFDLAETSSRKHQRQRQRREREEAERASSEAHDYCMRTSGYVYADDDAISNSSQDSAPGRWRRDDDMVCGRRAVVDGDGHHQQQQQQHQRKERKRMRLQAPESVVVQPKPSPAFVPADADMLLLPSSKADLREDLLESYFTDAKLEDSDFNIYC